MRVMNVKFVGRIIMTVLFVKARFSLHFNIYPTLLCTMYTVILKIYENHEWTK